MLGRGRSGLRFQKLEWLVEDGMLHREYLDSEGRRWRIRARPDVRREEAATNVALEFVAGREVRVVSCLRSEWEIPDPDLAGLLARSVVAGASRNIRPRPGETR
jgi:hypothetical protein